MRRLPQSAYRKALIIDADLVPAIVNLANIHYASDELIEAQALYERAINLEPDCFEAHFNLGNILHDLGRFDRALTCYRDAVALNPTYADAHFYLAVTLEKTGHSPEAKPHWKAYQELAPTGSGSSWPGNSLNSVHSHCSPADATRRIVRTRVFPLLWVRRSL